MRTQGQMRQRVVALFALGIAIPSGLLGYLAFRGVRNDQALFEREQREELEQATETAFAAHRSSIVEFGRRFEESLDRPTPFAESDPGSRAEAFGEGEPLVDAVFRASSEGDVEDFRIPGSLYRPEGWARTVSTGIGNPSSGAKRSLERARRIELRDGDLRAAEAAYESILEGSGDDRVRAEALNGVARVQRRRGRLEAAIENYRRITTEYDRTASLAGIPFGIAGRLELIRTYELSGDAESAAAESARLLETLLTGEHELSGVEYGFVADRTRETVEGLIADTPGGGGIGDLAVTLQALLDQEAEARARNRRIDRVREAVMADPGLIRTAVTDDAGGAIRLETLRIDGAPTYLLITAPDSASDGSVWEWALLLDPRDLTGLLEESIEQVSRASGFRWTLIDEGGRRIGGGPARVDDPSAIVVAAAHRFPVVTLEMLPPSAGIVESFLTSPRSVYLYAFVLVAGLLVFGLILTIRTLSQQLALSRMQADFVSTVSHEFKSPVTAIRQLAEMLQADRVPSEDRRRRYYDVLVEQSERLTALMDHILDFAKMESGYELERRPLDPGPHLEDVANRVQQRVRHQGYKVRREIEDDLPVVTLDPDAIALAVTNLIDNGIKYSGGAREVVVRAAARNGDLEIAVQDFGVGLDPTDRQHVFERFYRGGNPLTRSVKGTGLGLTLVKQIVDAHGGSIDVQSEPGEGSTFTIRLPTGTT